MSSLSLLSLITENSSDATIADAILKRIPFLKEYTFHIHEKDTLFLQKSEHSDVTAPMDDELMNLTIQLLSEFRYSKRTIRDNTFYAFSLRNGIYIVRAEGLDEIIRHVLNAANRKLSDRISYSEEIIVKEGNEFSPEQLDVVINKINQKFFELEDFTKKHHIKFF